MLFHSVVFVYRGRRALGILRWTFLRCKLPVCYVDVKDVYVALDGDGFPHGGCGRRASADADGGLLVSFGGLGLFKYSTLSMYNNKENKLERIHYNADPSSFWIRIQGVKKEKSFQQIIHKCYGCQISRN